MKITLPHIGEYFQINFVLYNLQSEMAARSHRGQINDDQSGKSHLTQMKPYPEKNPKNQL